MKKILILEDNRKTLEYLQNLAYEVSPGNEIFALDNRKDAYQCALEKRIDLFIVDIILDPDIPGDSSGLKFVDSIRQIKHYAFTPVIFETSLTDGKLYAYDKLHCYSYIEKPFQADQVKALIEQCLSFPSSHPEEKTLYFRKDGIILAVDREEIVYVESIRHMVHIHTCRKDVLKIPYMTIKKLLEEADSPDMVQCSRNTVINKRFVCNVDIPNGVIQLKDDLGRIEIGTKYKKIIKEIFR